MIVLLFSLSVVTTSFD